MFVLYTADRVNDYQHYAVDAVNSCSQYTDMGAQVKNSSESVYHCYTLVTDR